MRRTSDASIFMADGEPNGDTRAFAFAYGENEFMLLQMKGWGTGQALLRSPRGRNASRDGLVKLGWVHCLQYTLNCFQDNVCGLCRCEPSNHQLTLHNVI